MDNASINTLENGSKCGGGWEEGSLPSNASLTENDDPFAPPVMHSMMINVNATADIVIIVLLVFAFLRLARPGNRLANFEFPPDHQVTRL